MLFTVFSVIFCSFAPCGNIDRNSSPLYCNECKKGIPAHGKDVKHPAAGAVSRKSANAVCDPGPTWPASWETCVQVRKQQLELDMEQQTGSK